MVTDVDYYDMGKQSVGSHAKRFTKKKLLGEFFYYLCCFECPNGVRL